MDAHFCCRTKGVELSGCFVGLHNVSLHAARMLCGWMALQMRWVGRGLSISRTGQDLPQSIPHLQSSLTWLSFTPTPPVTRCHRRSRRSPPTARRGRAQPPLRCMRPGRRPLSPTAARPPQQPAWCRPAPDARLCFHPAFTSQDAEPAQEGATIAGRTPVCSSWKGLGLHLGRPVLGTREVHGRACGRGTCLDGSLQARLRTAEPPGGHGLPHGAPSSAGPFYSRPRFSQDGWGPSPNRVFSPRCHEIGERLPSAGQCQLHIACNGSAPQAMQGAALRSA